MTIIPNQKERDNAISQSCQDFIKRFRLNTLLREVNATKEKGICAYEIFAFLLGLVFSNKNLYFLLNTCPEKISFGKDAIYRFLSKGSTNWNCFIMKLACAVIQQIDNLTSTQRRTALIFDDSPYYRNRSKKVEMLSRCYDHVEKLYYKGLTLLAMGWSDGQSFVPVNAHLVAASQDKNLLNDSNVKTDNRTLATKRRVDARQTHERVSQLPPARQKFFRDS